MISYFKYTDTDIFKLDGNDYRGMINVVDGTPYTGTRYTSDSQELSTLQTFLGNVFVNNINFDTTFKKRVPLELSQIFPRTILTKSQLTNIIDSVNLNNLNIFASEVRYNPDYFNLLTYAEDELPITYHIAEISEEFSSTYLPVYRLPAPDGRKERTNTNKNSSFFLSQSGGQYKYFNNEFVLEGNAFSLDIPTSSRGIARSGFVQEYVSFNKYDNTLYVTGDTTYTIYNFNYASDNANITLVDVVDLTKINKTLTPYNSVYGKRYRSIVVYDQGDILLEVYGVKNTQLKGQFTTKQLNLDNILTVCQRFEDDVLVVYGTRGDDVILQVYDIPTLISTQEALHDNVILDSTYSDILEFAPFDSDVVMIKRYNPDNTLEVLEFRSISNPSYPLVTYKTEELHKMGIIEKNEIIDTVTDLLSACDIPLGNLNLISNSSYVYDIKFDVSDRIYCIIMYSDSFTVLKGSIFTSVPPLNLANTYTSETIADNSIGLTLNDLFKNIIHDTFLLYSYTTKVISYNSNTPFMYYPSYLPSIDTNNLYLYDNENVNVSSMNRIFNKLIAIQQNMGRAITPPQ